jgi:hypothetical protein
MKQDLFPVAWHYFLGLLIGLFCLAGGFFIWTEDYLSAQFVPCRGVVTYSCTGFHKFGGLYKSVVFEYEAPTGGQLIGRGRINGPSRDYLPGQHFTLYVDPANPKQTRFTRGVTINGYLWMVLGLLLMAIFGRLTIKSIVNVFKQPS